MNRLCFAIAALLCLSSASDGQSSLTNERYRVFDGRGNPATLEKIIMSVGSSDAVFLGEQHDDAVGHAVQMEIFSQAVARHSTDRRVALSLEMFERDVQIVLNEYLGGLISESHLISSGRAWPNYQTDYRPLVELAKEKKLDVIAANAPRRYVNMVSRSGRRALNGLSKDARKWIASLPYGEPSEAYAKKFKALMGPSAEAQMGIDNILASQSLWDATMAESISKYLKKHEDPLVIHLNGGFHSESRLGAVEHLLRYRSKSRVLVVNIRYETDFKMFDAAKHLNTGDFVILTDASVPLNRR
ncbi:MAG: ChaN family lipoprotein [Pyrinomonadaceae bacterium]